MPAPCGVDGAGLRRPEASTNPRSRGAGPRGGVDDERHDRQVRAGVYVDEVDSGARPIEAVGTAVAAFVGLAPAGPGIVVLRAAVLAGLVAVKRVLGRRRSASRWSAVAAGRSAGPSSYAGWWLATLRAPMR